jgi:propanol-preferring alcohol dehydrogenase
MGLAVLRKRGTLILVGLFGGAIELPLVTVPLKAITIQGAYTGNYNDMVELLGLAKRGVINPIISKHYKLTEANNALEDLKNRKILGRAVINP